MESSLNLNFQRFSNYEHFAPLQYVMDSINNLIYPPSIYYFPTKPIPEIARDNAVNCDALIQENKSEIEKSLNSNYKGTIFSYI